MKKNHLLFLCFVAALFLLAACQSAEQKNDKTVSTTEDKPGEKALMQELPNSANGITFTTEKEKYTTEDKEIIVNIQNENETHFTYEQQFSIEKNISGTWYELPFKEGMDIFEETIYSVKSKSSTAQIVSLDRLKDKPLPGKYRIVKTFNNPEDYYLEEEKSEKRPINSPTLAAPFEVVSKEKTITVEKRVGNEDKHGYFREITDVKQISKAINVLEKANWENAEVNMAYPPHYKFRFEHMEKETELDSVVYALWISPKKDKIELVMQGKGKYIQLNKSKSAELFEIITGEKLSDLK